MHAECGLVMGRDTRHHYKSCPYSSLCPRRCHPEFILRLFYLHDKKLRNIQKKNVHIFWYPLRFWPTSKFYFDQTDCDIVTRPRVTRDRIPACYLPVNATLLLWSLLCTPPPSLDQTLHIVIPVRRPAPPCVTHIMSCPLATKHLTPSFHLNSVDSRLGLGPWRHLWTHPVHVSVQSQDIQTFIYLRNKWLRSVKLTKALIIFTPLSDAWADRKSVFGEWMKRWRLV